MRLLEYQGKDLFKQYGIRVPLSALALSLDDARQLANSVGYPLVLKAQLTVGGRGKEGAILNCKSESELIQKFDYLIHRKVKGECPQGLLLEQSLNFQRELYLSIFFNRSKRCFSLIISSEGGIEVEATKGKIIADFPVNGMTLDLAESAILKAGIKGKAALSLVDVVVKLSKIVLEKEAELAEINPVAILADGSIVALDSKVIIDDNCLYRHPELKKYERLSELEAKAKKSGFSLVELDGNIAIIGNGAGLVMSTLDMVSDQGGKAGAFLDFGGRATTESVFEALQVISGIKHIEAILINLFGGIVKTTLVAQAILKAYQSNVISIPIFARISGAESDIAKDMLRDSRARLFETVEEAIGAVIQAIQTNESTIHE